MLQLSYKFSELKWNPYWVIVVTSSSCSNCVLNEHEYFEKYGLYVMPSELILCYRYNVSLVNQNEIPIELSQTLQPFLNFQNTFGVCSWQIMLKYGIFPQFFYKSCLCYENVADKTEVLK